MKFTAYTSRISVYVISVLPIERTARYAIGSPSYGMEWLHVVFPDRFKHSSNLNNFRGRGGRIWEGFMNYDVQVSLLVLYS
jgi:hypothetical protein